MSVQWCTPVQVRKDSDIQMLVVPCRRTLRCELVELAGAPPFFAELVRAPADLDAMQAAVGGLVELVPAAACVDACGFDAYCADDGKLRDLLANPAAGCLTLDPDVVGTLILVRKDKETDFI